ncbi:MAG: hypothetical protein ACRDSK_06545 [Actinophytocola sp.]|uniref:hypothetical protein n=1 Tax=Actinophytocola sp. TaxID=1872138 RepID=UPI003D6A6388
MRLHADGFVDEIRHEGDVVATAAALREHGVSGVLAGNESGVELACSSAEEARAAHERS